jgi:hypothetical protein
MAFSPAKRSLAFITAVLSISLLAMVQATPAQASHLRGSIVTTEYHAGTSQHPNAEVHLTATTLAAKNVPTGMNNVSVYRVTGNSVQQATLVTGCAGANSPTTTVDRSNPLFEITTNVFTLSGCFATPGDYIFSAVTSARIGGVVNTTNSAIQFESMVHIDGVNDSAAPTYNAGYMYNIAFESNLSYSTNLGGLGQGNTAVTYSLVTSSASALGGYGANIVPCSNLNTVTGAYQINSSYCQGSDTISSAFGGGARYYALKVAATDSTGQYSTRDVLLYFNTTSNQPPAFTSVPASGAFTVTPGTTSTAVFCAQDPDVNDVLNFTFSPTRTWITASASTPVSPATTPNTYCVTFTLAPPTGTTEAFNFEVSVYDNNNAFVRSASNIYSFQAGAILPSVTNPAFAYNPSSYTSESGAVFNIAAPSSTGTAVVSYTISPALPYGLVLDPATGAVTGSATAIGSVIYTVTGTDAQNATGTAQLTIEITAPAYVQPTGPEVITISPKVIDLGKDQEVTITGLRLDGVTNLVVRDLAIAIKSNTAESLTFVMPKQSTVGYAELSFKARAGSITWTNALMFRAAVAEQAVPAGPVGPASYTAVGFNPGSSILNPAVMKQIKSIASKVRGYSKISCVGVTMGPKILKQDAQLSKARAINSCAALKALLPSGTSFSTSNSQELETGPRIRRVEVFASN